MSKAAHEIDPQQFGSEHRLPNWNDAIGESRCRTVGGFVYHFMHGKLAGPEARGTVPQW
jgi:hypothetical protein